MTKERMIFYCFVALLTGLGFAWVLVICIHSYEEAMETGAVDDTPPVDIHKADPGDNPVFQEMQKAVAHLEKSNAGTVEERLQANIRDLEANIENLKKRDAKTAALTKPANPLVWMAKANGNLVVSEWKTLPCMKEIKKLIHDRDRLHRKAVYDQGMCDMARVVFQMNMYGHGKLPMGNNLVINCDKREVKLNCEVLK